MLSIIAMLVFALGVVVYFASDKAKELGRAMMWVGLFFVVGEIAGWHAIPFR